MRITKSGFYKVSEILKESDTEVEIEAQGKVALYDDTVGDTSIKIMDASHLEYYSFFDGDIGENKKFFKEVVLVGEKAQADINSLNYSSNNMLSVRILTESQANGGRLDTKILSFSGEKGNISVDGILKIGENTTGNTGSLDEENIFLGESGKISGIPTLYVETNDMEAGHACRMERISDEKLFYLRSRGIGRENALSIMIEAKITEVLQGLSEYDTDFYEFLIESILESVR